MVFWSLHNVEDLERDPLRKRAGISTEAQRTARFMMVQ